jgi:ParB-like chromosome segregation protein Spo0J
MLKMEFFLKQVYSDLIPRLSTGDYERLKKSIKDYGQQYPIIINQDHIHVLDGHHRLQACRELDIPVSYTIKNFDGKPLDELKYVVTININRRQLNEFERAEIALNVKKLYPTPVKACSLLLHS